MAESLSAGASRGVGEMHRHVRDRRRHVELVALRGSHRAQDGRAPCRREVVTRWQRRTPQQRCSLHTGGEPALGATRRLKCQVEWLVCQRPRGPRHRGGAGRPSPPAPLSTSTAIAAPTTRTPQATCRLESRAGTRFDGTGRYPAAARFSAHDDSEHLEFHEPVHPRQPHSSRHHFTVERTSGSPLASDSSQSRPGDTRRTSGKRANPRSDVTNVAPCSIAKAAR